MKTVKFIAVLAFALISTATFAQKFGSIKQDEVLQKMITKDSVDVKMQAYQLELQQTYQALQTEYETKAQDLQKKMAGYSETILQQKQKELQRVLQSLQEFEQVASTDIQAKQQELMAPVYKKFTEAAESIGKEGSFIMIFNAAQPLFVNPSSVTDLTGIITKKLGLE